MIGTCQWDLPGGENYSENFHHTVFCSIFSHTADVLSEVDGEEADADELVAAALSEGRGREGTYPNPHRPGPIDPQVHVSQMHVCAKYDG